MEVLDVRLLAERHPEWGPRGVVFASYEELRDYLDVGGDGDVAETPASPAVH